MAEDTGSGGGGHGAAAAGGAGIGLLALLRVCSEVGVVDDVARVGTAARVAEDVGHVGAGVGDDLVRGGARVGDDLVRGGAVLGDDLVQPGLVDDLSAAAARRGTADDLGDVVVVGEATGEGRAGSLAEDLAPDAVEAGLDLIDAVDLSGGPGEDDGVWLGEVTDLPALFRTLPAHAGRTVGFVGRTRGSVLQFGDRPGPLEVLDSVCELHRVSCWVYLLPVGAPVDDAARAWMASEVEPVRPEHGTVRIVGR